MLLLPGMNQYPRSVSFMRRVNWAYGEARGKDRDSRSKLYFTEFP